MATVLEMKFTLPDTRSDNGWCHCDRLIQCIEKHMDSYSALVTSIHKPSQIHKHTMWFPLSVFSSPSKEVYQGHIFGLGRDVRCIVWANHLSEPKWLITIQYWIQEISNTWVSDHFDHVYLTNDCYSVPTLFFNHKGHTTSAQSYSCNTL